MRSNKKPGASVKHGCICSARLQAGSVDTPKCPSPTARTLQNPEQFFQIHYFLRDSGCSCCLH